ncbi:MAG: sodium:solute symporter family protein [Desulfatibacillum sp.]|nr:sodium:solute symporter family protein [Desulfatibacillum sp.]
MHYVDQLIMGLYLATILFVGLWSGRGLKTLEDFSVAGRGFRSWVVFATLSASFIGGGFTMGNAEKVYTIGFVNILALYGFSLKEILVATIIAPRMARFPRAMSVGGIIGESYGKSAQVTSGIFGFLLCAGILGAQVGAMGYVFNLFLGMDQIWGIIIGCGIAITYSTVGGMRAVVFTDILQFGILAIGIPLALFMGVDKAGGWSAMLHAVPAERLNPLGGMGLMAFGSLFLTFLLGETLVPPYVQRLMIGRTSRQTARGTLWSGLFSFPFFAITGCIGLLALAMNPGLDPNLALPYVIQEALPIGLKGLVVAGIISVVMSSADSFLNGAAVSLVSDMILPLRKKSLGDRKTLLIAQGVNLLTGITAVIFAVKIKSILGILMFAYNFWAPVILPPLVAAFFGVKARGSVFMSAAIAGIASTWAWNTWVAQSSGVDGLIVGVMANAVVFFICLKTMGEPKE